MKCTDCEYFKEFGGWLPTGTACFIDKDNPDYSKGVNDNCDKNINKISKILKRELFELQELRQKTDKEIKSKEKELFGQLVKEGECTQEEADIMLWKNPERKI